MARNNIRNNNWLIDKKFNNNPKNKRITIIIIPKISNGFLLFSMDIL
ncbi:MAG: hypothetical protein ABIG60_01650 [Patescibacteria group bacterium]